MVWKTHTHPLALQVSLFVPRPHPQQWPCACMCWVCACVSHPRVWRAVRGRGGAPPGVVTQSVHAVRVGVAWSKPSLTYPIFLCSPGVGVGVPGGLVNVCPCHAAFPPCHPRFMWDTYHVIGPDSPLASVTPELLAALREGNCASLLGGRITVIFSGVDTFMVGFVVLAVPRICAVWNERLDAWFPPCCWRVPLCGGLMWHQCLVSTEDVRPLVYTWCTCGSSPPPLPLGHQYHGSQGLRHRQ
jgi:hypothetical protein